MTEGMHLQTKKLSDLLIVSWSLLYDTVGITIRKKKGRRIMCISCPNVPHLGYVTIVQVGDSAVTTSSIERYTSSLIPFFFLMCS